MLKNSTLLLGCCSFLLLSGCGLFGSDGDQTAEESLDQVQVNVQVPVEQPSEEDELPFEEPLVAAAPEPDVQQLGLIPYTPPAERLRRAQAERGRSNPFDTLSGLTGRIRLPTPPEPEPPPPVEGGNGGGGLPPVAGGGAGTGAGTGTGTGTTTPGPQLPQPKPLPEAELAKAVFVTGVVQIGPSLQAIIKAPEEATARYVTEGQRLSNGQILVKRIELRGSEPIVVLEEKGIEVTKLVGEQPESLPESETDTATASAAI
ncbi:MAG: hypothetical protein AAGF24_01075 [Cyanobacteria bacterium P01_H01_bin.121]